MTVDAQVNTGAWRSPCVGGTSGSQPVVAESGPPERQVDRVLERQRGPGGKLGCEELRPEPDLQPQERFLLAVVLLDVVRTEVRHQFLHPAEQTSSDAGVACLGFHHR